MSSPDGPSPRDVSSSRCGVRVLYTHADVNEYRLVNKLLGTYDKRIRPSLNASQALNVTFGLALSQIIDVDEKNQILTTNCWLNQMWIDYSLRWNPDEYGGIKVARIPYDSVWRPDIFLYNNADVSTYFSSISSNIIVTNDGNITWLSMVIFKSSCSINVRYFPFDEQNCSMQFASWTYDGFQVNLVLVTHEGDISNYIQNSEWDLQRLYVSRKVVYYSCCTEPYPDITFYIHIRRRPLFYIFNMVMPCILITLVALLGFYVPSDSGEKVTMGITTLLSMTVFMMLVAENMPPTSNVLPLLGIYYGITIFIVSTATGMTVLTLNIHHKGHRGREVPKTMKKIFFGVFAKLMCMRLEYNDVDKKGKIFTPSDYPGNGVGTSYIPYKMTSEPDHTRPPYRLTTEPPDMTIHSSNRMSTDPPELFRHKCCLNNEPDQGTRQTYRLPQDPDIHHPLLGYHGLSEQTTNRKADSQRDSKQCNGTIPSAPPIPPLPTRLPAPSAQCSPSRQTASTTIESFETHFHKVLQKVYQTIETNEMRLVTQDRKDVIKMEWQQVAQVVDRILLSAFVLATLVITCAVMFQKPPPPE
ncbi:neuronal acetylcholine receptor subunit alpha-10-like [Argopecten irradians]|uniref:neuronal acetylcholine receptor subunit alpha-10-like n=1 Tax=Argopecten irradians TaxID=31199 RepID=UPI00371ED80F